MKLKSDTQIIRKCKVGKGTKIWNFVNLYGAEIGRNCMIGSYVEIQNGVKIGNNVRIQSHSFLCSGVVVEDDVFIGHHVCFINDKYPTATLAHEKKWVMLPTLVKKGASIGSNATIFPVIIGEKAQVGAGAVVLDDVGDYCVVVGVPAKNIQDWEEI